MNDCCIQKVDNFEIEEICNSGRLNDSPFVNMAKTVTLLSLYLRSGKI
jgi:hypothetical protein